MGQNLGPGPQIGKSIFSVKYPIEQCSKPWLVDDKRDDTTQYIGDYTKYNRGIPSNQPASWNEKQILNTAQFLGYPILTHTHLLRLAIL